MQKTLLQAYVFEMTMLRPASAHAQSCQIKVMKRELVDFERQTRDARTSPRMHAGWSGRLKFCERHKQGFLKPALMIYLNV